jgi:hypothetical protein
LIWKKQLHTEQTTLPSSTFPSSFDLHFHTDAAGLPGTEVYVATGLVFMGVPGYIIPLTTPAMLTEATCWVSVVDNITGFDLFWDGRSITNNGFATALSASFLFLCVARVRAYTQDSSSLDKTHDAFCVCQFRHAGDSEL